jgi:hypothetical protein
VEGAISSVKFLPWQRIAPYVIPHKALSRTLLDTTTYKHLQECTGIKDGLEINWRVCQLDVDEELISKCATSAHGRTLSMCSYENTMVISSGLFSVHVQGKWTGLLGPTWPNYCSKSMCPFCKSWKPLHYGMSQVQDVGPFRNFGSPKFLTGTLPGTIACTWHVP